MSIEEEFQDVLQNIEAMIMQVYTTQPDLTDYEVDRAIEALMDYYRAEQMAKTPRAFQLNEKSLMVYEFVQKVCEFRLGRRAFESATSGEQIALPEPITLDQLQACLKRIRKSIRTWSSHNGRQGYLQFVRQFFS